MTNIIALRAGYACKGYACKEKNLKEILLFGRVEREDLICNLMEHAQGYKFRHTSSATKALKMLEKTSPEFIIVTGNIGKNGDGSYYIEL